MNKFYIIGETQYYKDFEDGDSLSYEELVLPTRSTSGSAGYDFISTVSFTLNPGDSIKIPTGIKVQLDSDKVLVCVPRSGLGFKYCMGLANTLGIIDSDYIGADNEGHIWVKVVNNGDKSFTVNKGDKLFQGIILQCFTTVDDVASEKRTGGFGSTGK